MNGSMTNGEIVKVAGGAAVSLAGAATSYMSHVEQLLRMGASLVAILSGLVVIWSVVRKHRNKKDTKNETED